MIDIISIPLLSMTFDGSGSKWDSGVNELDEVSFVERWIRPSELKIVVYNDQNCRNILRKS